MRLLIIRHGDPDYEKDSLTEKGWREAKYLSERLEKENITKFYVSPLGRAKDTASFTLEKYGAQAEEMEWLREFDKKRIWRPDVKDNRIIPWDWLPQDWTVRDEFYDAKGWQDNEIMKEAQIGQEYQRVIESFDRLLAKHGYERNGRLYHVTHSNNDTLAFFCHFGLGCVLISHLLGVSPVTLWHGCCAAPSSVTTFTTEERREGKALFRMNSFGDISHLYAHGEPPAFAARYCETFDNADQRHD